MAPSLSDPGGHQVDNKVESSETGVVSSVIPFLVLPSKKEFLPFSRRQFLSLEVTTIYTNRHISLVFVFELANSTDESAWDILTPRILGVEIPGIEI